MTNPYSQRFARPALRLGLLAVLALAIGGCQQSVSMANPVPVAEHEYDRVFDQAVDVLRRHRFVVERQDRRFGVISTHPQVASSVFEPWRGDNTTARQVAENTLNLRRRRVRILIEPALTADTVEAPDTQRPRYELFVEVMLEQRQHPPTPLHTAEASLQASYTRDPGRQSLETEKGLVASDWRPVGRDAELEQRLVAEILVPAAAAGGDSDSQADPAVDRKGVGEPSS